MYVLIRRYGIWDGMVGTYHTTPYAIRTHTYICITCFACVNDPTSQYHSKLTQARPSSGVTTETAGSRIRGEGGHQARWKAPKTARGGMEVQ